METSKNNSILLISNDNFIIGMLNGYGLANQLTVSTKPTEEQISPDEVENSYKLIIVDIRDLEKKSTKAYLKVLEKINKDSKIPICAIFNHADQQDIQEESWIDFYLEDPIMEKLDGYLREHFSYNFHPFPDRRNNDRRNRDRRNGNNHEDHAEASSVTGSQKLNVSRKTHRDHYKTGPFTVNISSQAVYFKEKNLNLTRKEFKLFTLLAADIDHIFTPQEIINHLWPENNRANKSDLYQYMHLLRKKVEVDPYSPHWIITLKGIGYRLNIKPPIESINTERQSIRSV
ncbi:winged helix-turn-helix domain-containing protein [Neptunomonas qingdaonensis]|uniref:DNA-binding response regulator, OmpR family, contains REC and winged-helix (WHTH) domain n=1 Tax=Neptunomonas qingdaonensis TaxID=1045558 RepID=A0A1I2QAA7_9GAMM|nr:helix-turn-helix domain-containing protein [Neptunomonas qingdaonensis]SFG25274.1 DNA-binding response regulator, OmpR family, contains REC and winged-helix (wHTH) domain [Neptunomonas qingdaonensis]